MHVHSGKRKFTRGHKARAWKKPGMPSPVAVLVCLAALAVVVLLAGCKTPEDALSFSEQGLTDILFSDARLNFRYIEDWHGDLVLFRDFTGVGMTFATYDLGTRAYNDYPLYQKGFGGASFLAGEDAILFDLGDFDPALYILDLSTGLQQWLATGSDPMVMPDGNSILYARGGDLRQMDLETRESQPYRDLDFYYHYPHISPSGDCLAFLGYDSNQYDLTPLMLLYLENQALVTKHINGLVHNLAWSPDSGQLALSGAFPESRCILFYDMEQSCIVGRVCASDAFTEIFWSPDGAYLVLHGKGGDWLGLEIQKLRQLGFLDTECIEQGLETR